MRKIILFFIFLLMVQFTLADNEYGKIISGNNLLITDVDVTVDDKTSRNLEYGDEITKRAYQSSKLEFKVEVTNNHTSLDMTDVEMVIEIDDLELDDSTGEVDIGETDDKKLSLSFTIPSDADEDEYDVLIEVRGELNNTLHKVEYKLIIDVNELEEDITDTERVSIINQIKSLNSSINKVTEEIGSYFNPYTECISKLSSCESKLPEKEKQITTYKTFEGKYTGCTSELDIEKNKNFECLGNIKGLKNNETNIITEMTKQRQSYQWVILGVALIGVLAFWQKDRLTRIKGESEEEVTTKPEVE